MATMNQAPQQGAQQGIEQQVVQLVQAAVQGDQKATQQIEQIMQAAQQGNQEAIQIAQIIQKVIQAMQAKQGVKAQLGAKLNYINKLKGNCPDGQETYYFKDGGQMKKGCKPCMEKAKEGKKLDKKMNEVQKFKAQKGADSKKFINPNDTVNTKFGPRDLNGNTKFPKYDASKENYDTATRIRVHEKDGTTGHEGPYWSVSKEEAQKSKKTEKTEKKLCGGKAKKKAKKHYLGGPAEVINQPLTEQRPRFNYAKGIERPTTLKTPEQIKWEGRAENFLKTGKWEGGTEDRSQLIQNKAMLERIAAMPGRRQPMYQYMSRYVNDNFGSKGSIPSSRELVSKGATIESPEEAAKSMRLNSPEYLKGLQKTYGHANVKVGDDGYYYHPAQAVNYAIGTNY